MSIKTNKMTLIWKLFKNFIIEKSFMYMIVCYWAILPFSLSLFIKNVIKYPMRVGHRYKNLCMLKNILHQIFHEHT